MMSREFTAEVRPDGSFEFESIPPGAGQIIGICNGWASARVIHGLRPGGTRDRQHQSLGVRHHDHL
jgi:hypothetical protein